MFQRADFVYILFFLVIVHQELPEFVLRASDVLDAQEPVV